METDAGEEIDRERERIVLRRRRVIFLVFVLVAGALWQLFLSPWLYPDDEIARIHQAAFTSDGRKLAFIGTKKSGRQGAFVWDRDRNSVSELFTREPHSIIGLTTGLSPDDLLVTLRTGHPHVTQIGRAHLGRSELDLLTSRLSSKAAPIQIDAETIGYKESTDLEGSKLDQKIFGRGPYKKRLYFDWYKFTVHDLKTGTTRTSDSFDGQCYWPLYATETKIVFHSECNLYFKEIGPKRNAPKNEKIYQPDKITTVIFELNIFDLNPIKYYYLRDVTAFSKTVNYVTSLNADMSGKKILFNIVENRIDDHRVTANFVHKPILISDSGKYLHEHDGFISPSFLELTQDGKEFAYCQYSRENRDACENVHFVNTETKQKTISRIPKIKSNIYLEIPGKTRLLSWLNRE